MLASWRFTNFRRLVGVRVSSFKKIPCSVGGSKNFPLPLNPLTVLSNNPYSYFTFDWRQKIRTKGFSIKKKTEEIREENLPKKGLRNYAKLTFRCLYSINFSCSSYFSFFSSSTFPKWQQNIVIKYFSNETTLIQLLMENFIRGGEWKENKFMFCVSHSSELY